MIKPNKNRLAFIASLNLEEISVLKVNAIWDKYETGIHNSVRNHGPRHTLDHYKECYKFLRNSNLELPTQPIPGCKVDKFGFPKTLGPLRSLIKGDQLFKRVALTIARSYELITLPIDYHPKSIDEPSSYDEKFEETTKDFKEWLGKFTNKYPGYLGSLHMRDSYEPRVFTTLSRGPNGSAVASAHLDAKAVVSDSILFSAIKRLNEALGQTGITDGLVNMAETVTGENEGVTGRLGFSAEPAGKTRVFAIADYGSQTSLKVIQDSLYNTLKAISTDCTRDQDKGFKSLLMESKDKPTYCFDLTAASDRIPAVMQKFRLELMGGQALGEAGLSVMTERSFYVKRTKEGLRGSVGQPLGLLSSFPSFALGHHDIVQYAHYRCRMRRGLTSIKFFKDYRLLGDDLVIFNKEVADEYQYLITEVYKINVNLSKSVIGDSTNSQIEFTKRLALRGKEISSIKRNILTKSGLKFTLDLIDILFERDYIQRDTQYYDVYPFLGKEEQNVFNFMLWLRSDCDAPFKFGVTSNCLIERNTVSEMILVKRHQNLMEKTQEMQRVLDSNRSLDTYYKSCSLPYSTKALGLDSYQNDNLKLHPIVWALNQTGMDLSIALSTIWDEPNPDVAPVEYLPFVSLKSYFYTPRKASKEYLSKLILDVYKELSNELNKNS